MDNWLARTRLLLGDEAVNSLRHSRVAVLGLGGVGGAAAEAICRSGVGAMLLADYDRVDITNLNRQLIAVTSTVGHDKTEAAARRLRDINPELDLTLREGPDIGVSLPGSGESPVAPVYIRGEKAGVLKGADIAKQFQDIIEKFVRENYAKQGS